MNVVGMVSASSGALMGICCLGFLLALANSAFDEWKWWGTASIVGIVVAAAGLGLVS